MNSLVFLPNTVEGIRATLLAHRPREAGAILLAGHASISGATRLLVREVIEAPPNAYSVQDEFELALTPVFLAPLVKRARREGWSLIFVHTHPFDGPVHFSPADDYGERLLMPSIFARTGDRPHGALVFGPCGFDARIWQSPKHSVSVEAIIEVGSDISITSREANPKESLSVFERNVRALGAEGQALVRTLTVGIVGLGGIGSIVAEQLAYLGVGRLILLDPDNIEATNLNRLVGASGKDIGRPKVDVVAKHVRRIRPEIDVKAINGSLLMARDAKALLSAHLVFGCTDTHGSRAILNQMAYQYLIPVIDTGVTIDATGGPVSSVAGRIQMLAPGLPCLVCHGLLRPDWVRRDLMTDEERARDTYILGNNEPQPSVISLNGLVASLGVTMFLSAMTGFPSSARHQIYRGEHSLVRAVEATRDPVCVVCSLRGALGRGDLWPLPWRQ